MRSHTIRARYTAGTIGTRQVPSYVDEPGVDPSRRVKASCPRRTNRPGKAAARGVPRAGRCRRDPAGLVRAGTRRNPRAPRRGPVTDLYGGEVASAAVLLAARR